MALYLDTSALVKLVVEEPETATLKSRIAGQALVSSELAIAELGRATLRSTVEERDVAMTVLRDAHLLLISTSLLRTAGVLQPSALRTLDAIHVASALLVADECECVITYDRRMREAARLVGLRVEAPGQLDSDADN